MKVRKAYNQIMASQSDKPSIAVITLGPVCIAPGKCRRIPMSLNHRLHWMIRKKWNDAWKEEVGWLAKSNRIKNELNAKLPLIKAKITVQLFTIRKLDRDNSYTCSKAIIDGLKGIILTDDDDEHLDLAVTQVKVGTRLEEHVELIIERIQ